MAAPKNPHKPWGNEFWKSRKNTVGKDPIFETAEKLLEACEGYIKWVNINPLKEERLVSYKGVGTVKKINKMRAMTIKALCYHIGISYDTWRSYREKEHLKRVCEDVKAIMWEHNFTGATADLLNANLVARELGIKEKQEHTHKYAHLSKEDIEKQIKELEGEPLKLVK